MERCLHSGLFSSQKVHIDSSMRWKLFSLYGLKGVLKNPSFYTDLKNVHLTLIKSASKTVLLIYHSQFFK
jgi:hypothetical protein